MLKDLASTRMSSWVYDADLPEEDEAELEDPDSDFSDDEFAYV